LVDALEERYQDERKAYATPDTAVTETEAQSAGHQLAPFKVLIPEFLNVQAL